MSKIHINIKEASEILGVSKLTLRNWDKSGKLVAYRHPINNYRVYRTEDINDILQKMKSYTKEDLSEKIETISPSDIPKENNTTKQKVYNLKDLLQK